MAPTPFVLLTLTRSGSTWLLSLLNGQPRVAAYEELFLDRPVAEKYAWVAAGSPPRFHAQKAELGGWRGQQLHRYLDSVRDFREDVGTYGFKLMLGHLRETPALLPMLALRRYRLICLIRDNVFEAAISRFVMQQGGEAQARRPAEAGASPRIRIAPEAFVGEIRKRQRGKRLLTSLAAAWPWPSRVVDYGRTRAAPLNTLSEVLATLGMPDPPVPVESPLSPRITRPHEEMVENLDEILETVAAQGLSAALPARLHGGASLG